MVQIKKFVEFMLTLMVYKYVVIFSSCILTDFRMSPRYSRPNDRPPNEETFLENNANNL